MQEVVSEKERLEILRAIMSIPIGAGKRFLVKGGGADTAGFDTQAEAYNYIAMMKKGSDKAKAPSCAKMDWTVVDRG